MSKTPVFIDGKQIGTCSRVRSSTDLINFEADYSYHVDDFEPISESVIAERHRITLNDYQHIAGRTANPHRNALINYALGIAGEVADIIKKYSFHGHELDKDDLAKELGDVLWYLSNIANEVGIDLERIAMLNIEKLQKRYPNGFDQERSINREVTK